RLVSDWSSDVCSSDLDALRGGVKPSALRVGDYARGGALEALRVQGRPKLCTQNWQGPPVIAHGQALAIDWVRIEDPDPDTDVEHPMGEPRTWVPAPSSTPPQTF